MPNYSVGTPSSQSDGYATQERDAFPGFRVFIWGLEVTDDVLDYNYNATDGRQPSQIQFTLQMGQDPTINPDGTSNIDKYIVTDRDMYYIIQNTTSIYNKPKAGATNSALYPTPFAGMMPNNTLLNANGQPVMPKEAFPQITDNFIIPAVKKNVLDRKIAINNAQPDQTDNSPVYTTLDGGLPDKYMYGALEYYPFESGKPIFHANDPIRIATRDPFNPNRWYWRFSGMLSDFVDTRDQNNTQTLTITAEGPTKLLRYARFSANPGIIDSKLVSIISPQGGSATADQVARTFTVQKLAGKTLPEILAFIFFGANTAGNANTSGSPPASTQQQQNNAAGTSTPAPAAQDPYPDRCYSYNSGSGGQLIMKPLYGIGNLRPNKAAIFLYGNQTTSPTQLNTPADQAPAPSSTAPTSANGITVTQIATNQLANYQAVIDHEVMPTDLMTMLQADLLSTATVSGGVNGMPFPSPVNGAIPIADVITFIGSNPHLYPVDGGRVVMLLPASIGVLNSGILDRTFISDVSISNTPWMTKGEQLYNVLERIQFVCYETGKGDIILEMPLYDFDPSDWGLGQISDLNSIDPWIKKIANQLGSNYVTQSRGPFGSRYIFTNEDVDGWSNTFTDEKVRTQCITSPYIVGNFPDIGKQIDITAQNVAVVNLTHLVPLFGIRSETADPPGYVTQLQGAQVFAYSFLNRLNADAYSASISTVPMVHAWLNRPYWFVGRNHIGTTRSIAESLTWGTGGSMSNRFGLHAMRGWKGDLDQNNRPIYLAINGYPSRPLNYAALFNKAPVVSNQPGPASSQGSPGVSDAGNLPIGGPASNTGTA